MVSLRHPILFLLLSAAVFSSTGFALAPSMPGDLNGDGVTDHLDFFLFALSYDPHGRGASAAEDFNQDFEIDTRDLFLALLGRLHRDAALPPIDPNETGALEGVVLEDVGDALVVIPIGNANVFILTPTGHRFQTVTDENGAFAAAELPIGRASIRVEHPNFYPSYRTLEIVAGETHSVTLHLSPRVEGSSVVRGKVLGAESPFVDFQYPLAGAVLRIIPLDEGTPVTDEAPSHTPGESSSQQAVFTNDQGFYEIHALPTGSYRLVAAAKDHQPESRDISVEEGEERVEDFILYVQPDHSGVLQGRILSAAGEESADKLIPGASVWMERIDPGPPDPNLTDPIEPVFFPFPHLQATTDEEGRYEISGIAPGNYRVHVWAMDHLPSGAEIGIASGERLEKDFRLTPIVFEYGAVQGTVSGATSESESPTPLEGAWVTLLPSAPLEYGQWPWDDETSIESLPPGVHTILTDEEGRFRFDRVRTGEYRVEAHKPGWGPASATVEVTVDATSTVDLVVAPIPPPLPSALAGTVWRHPLDVTAVILPASGAQVVVITADSLHPDWLMVPPPEGSPPLIEPWPHIFTTQTDAEGRYRFESLPAGKALVVVHYPDYQTGEAWVELPPGVEAMQDFLLQPLLNGPGKVLGRVTFSPPSRASEQVPIVGARVALYGQSAYPLPIPLPYPNADATQGGEILPPNLPPVLFLEATTDSNGYFEFPEVAAGMYRIEVSAAEFQTERHDLFVSPGDTVALSFDLIPDFGTPDGATLEGVVWGGGLTLQPGDVLPAIPGALVVAALISDLDHLTDGGIEPANDSVAPRQTLTDDRGRYRFDNLTPGVWAVMAVAEGFLPAVQRVGLEPGGVGRLNFQLAPIQDGERSGLHGIISQWTPFPTFAPVPVEGAEISLFPLLTDPAGTTEGPWVTISDAQGEYRFPDLPPGPYTLTVRAEGFAPVENLQVAIPPGSRIRQDVVLYPTALEAGSLHGRVFEGAGPDGSDPSEPLPGAIVRLIPDWMAVILIFPPPDVGFDRVTNENGEYSFDSLPAGGYSVTALKEGYTPTLDRVEIHPGQLHERDWRLAPVSSPNQAGDFR